MIEHLKLVTALFEDYSGRWAFCGGWAIDLYLNRLTRPHKDVDIAIPRCQQQMFASHLQARGWTLKIAHDGQLTPWDGGSFIELPCHALWCENKKNAPDFIEVLLNEVEDNVFRFRRDQSIQVSMEQAFAKTQSGFVALAPEIVLLYKSAYPHDGGNQFDFENCIEVFTEDQKRWLYGALKKLSPHHEWLKEVA